MISAIPMTIVWLSGYYQDKSRFSWRRSLNLIMARASSSAISLRSRRSRREGSFGRAAERLGYTQSAVSQQIATLERIVGEKLVERPGGPRAVSLTEAGELLLRHAEAIVARLEAARADMASLRAGETGTLRVGTYQSVGARVLPAVMRRFRADGPGIELALSEPTTDPELYALIESGELDLAFCSPPLPEGPFEASS